MMTVADARLDLEALPAPRRVAVAGLLDEIHATERALADFYARFAAHTAVPALRAGLEALARATVEQVERLAPLADAVAAYLDAGRADAGAIEPVAPRAQAFLAVFQVERHLDMHYREVLALLAEGGVPAPLREAAVQASQHRARLRDLYLTYS
jgi:hypothetical protein